jgi:hypothetical protein
MCAALDIQIIPASSPQAKGRIERNHGTHQDRLVKKLRRRGIRELDTANAFLAEEYWAEHNARFAQAPAATDDLHGPAPGARALAAIFQLETRRVGQQRLGGPLSQSALATGATHVPAAGAQHRPRPRRPSGRGDDSLSRRPYAAHRHHRATPGTIAGAGAACCTAHARRRRSAPCWRAPSRRSPVGPSGRSCPCGAGAGPGTTGLACDQRAFDR